MKILHVITGLPKSAGTTTFVENVVREQCALGHKVALCTILKPEMLEVSALRNSRPDVIHIHALWSSLVHRASRAAAQCGIPVVWSTHGMTAPWSLRHKWWKKCLPWHLYQKGDLKRAALIHCTTDLEAEWNQALGFTRTFIAPLGTTLHSRGGTRSVASADGTEAVPPEHLPHSSAKTLLYVGRLYPVKALDNLIRAFALALRSYTPAQPPSQPQPQPSTSTSHLQPPTSTSPWTLRIVGPDQAGHQAELMKLCDDLKLNYSALQPSTSTSNLQPVPAVQFPGPKFGDELDAEYANCTALALVSHTENFGATVVDAMAHGKPVITSTKTPWKIVADSGCGWWVDNDPETLAETLLQLFNASASELSSMGEKGRALVASRYTWPAVARNLVEHYQTLVRESRI